MQTSYDDHVSSSKGWAMLAAGAAGGLLLGKFLPVLIANASGTIRAGAGQDPFESLIRQHRELLSLLDQMESTSTENFVKRTALALKFKRTIAKHAMAEEDVVYPLLHDDTDRAEAVEKLYREHAGMKIHLFELQRSVKDHDSWIANVRSLRAEIEPHARQEEEVEFPRLRGILNQRKSVNLSRKIQQEESLIV
jgi:iron-sulfur cluster repair protein YtfE (RIC family)